MNDSNKKVLVTGGAGFIGSNLVRLLLEKSYKVVVLDNLSTGYKENLEPFPEVEFILGDVRDDKIVDKALDEIEIVFHLAACIGNVKSLEDPIFDSNVNILGTLNILEKARWRGVKKIVYSSSAAIYGEPHHLPIDEEHPLYPDSFYGVSKLAAEKHCYCCSKIYDLDIVALRYFNVYGSNQRYDAYGNVVPIFATCLLKGEPLNIYGDGEQTRDFVNVEDIIQANLAAAETEKVRGSFNIGSGVSLTVNKLADIIQSVSGISTKIKHQSERPGEVKHSSSDISRAKKVLGYAPQVSVEQGLNNYMKWIKTLNI
ncbi:MAG: NAD-dependent epimerase/dehydratase family protein [Candidatus Omnitrophota bacterium]